MAWRRSGAGVGRERRPRRHHRTVDFEISVDRAGRSPLLQLDRAVDLERKRNSTNRDRGFCRQRLAALESAARHRIAHRLFDLTLRSDAELLEELAHAGIQYLLVHVPSDRKSVG